MSILNNKDIKKLKDADLTKKLETALKDLFVLKMKKKMWDLKETHLIKAMRIFVAKLKTEKRSREIA